MIAAAHLLAHESYGDLMTSPAHIGAELTMEVITAVVAFAFGWVRSKRRAIRQHDAKYHADAPDHPTD